jgi:hypothetical protein
MRDRTARWGAAVVLLASLGGGRATAQGTLTSDDGLSISMSESGAIQSLRLAGQEYASTTLPSGFAFRELGATADVLKNGSLEAGGGVPSEWRWTDDANGSWSWDASIAASGSRSLRVDVPGSTSRRSPTLTSTAFPLRPNTPYTMSCQIRTAALNGSLDVYVVEQDALGRVVQRGFSSDSGTHDWQTRRLTFVTSPIAVSASLKFEVYSGHGTAWIDDVRMLDVFAGKDPEAFGGSVSASGGEIRQSSSVDGLELEAHFSSAGDAILVDATVSDTTGRDRAIEVTFRLPLDVPGWSWEQNPAVSFPITDGVRFENLDSFFGTQTHSVYPFATVRNATAAFTLATPLTSQMNRFTYDRSNGLRVTWDVGLSPAALKTPSKATLSFWIYSQDPRWGMRAAAEKYQALNDGDFVSSVNAAAGAWVIPAEGHTLETVAGFQDFGWGFLEGVSDIDFGNDHGISVAHYVDASGYFRSFPGVTSQPSYDALVAALESDAANGGSSLNDGVPRQEMARATIQCSPHDADGRYQVDADPYFWYGNRLQIYPVSPDPDIPAPSMWNIATRYSVDGRLAWAANRGGHLGGIFLDDVSGTFAAVENYRKELWAYSDAPLTYSWETGRVILLDGFSIAEFCGSFRKYAHDRGLYLMGSINPAMYTWFGRYFDVLGGECQGAESLERAYVRRFLGNGRPWSNLFVPLDRQAPDAVEVLAYLRQALLFGYFPGFNGAYWNVPSAYERDREQFRRYIPLIRTVAQAGWAPVSGTTIGDPAVLIERFDSRRGGILYLTAQNTGSASKSVQFSLDAAVLAIDEGTVAISELLRGKTLTTARSGGQISFSDTIPAGETFLYRIAAPRSAPDRGRTRSVGTRR